MRKILYLQYTNPAAYPPLEHSAHILLKHGWNVLFLGIKSHDTDALKFSPYKKVAVRQLPYCPPGWRQKLHYLHFTVWAFFVALRWRPQWIYASDPLSCPAALLLSLLPAVGVIYHEHDTPPDGANKGVFLRFVAAARAGLARRARLCILPNEERARHFGQELSVERVMCVWNCPSQEEIAAPRAAHGEQLLWVLYHGSIVPARLPMTVLTALSLVPKSVKLRVIGYETIGHRGYVRELKETAARLNLSEQVEFVGSVPTRDELLAWCRKSDVGLAFMPKHGNDINMKHMTGASNKAFDYLACGLALIVSDLPDWRAMYVDSGYGLACDLENPESIAAAIGWFFEHRSEMREMGELGRQKILTDWNYEIQFAPVLNLLTKEKLEFDSKKSPEARN